MTLNSSRPYDPRVLAYDPALCGFVMFYTAVDVCLYLTTVFMKDVGEAVENAITTATVGAAFLNPLTMRYQPTAPTERGVVNNRRLHTIGSIGGCSHLMRWSYSQFLPVKNGGHAQKLPRMQVPPFLQQLRLCSAATTAKTRNALTERRQR